MGNAGRLIRAHGGPSDAEGNSSTNDRVYQSGFGNEYATEAVPGALPQGRNTPQRAPFDLYPELPSGTAFTAPRNQNRRTWMYRRQPSVIAGRYQPYEQPLWTTGADREAVLAPKPLRWHPIPIETGVDCDFVDGLRTLAANGDADAQCGVGRQTPVCAPVACEVLRRRSRKEHRPSGGWASNQKWVCWPCARQSCYPNSSDVAP